MKSSFIMHFSQRQAFERMTDEQAGKCIKRVFEYAETGQHSVCDDDPAVCFSLLFITERMDKDAAIYTERCKKNKESGEKGGRPPKNRTVTSETERLLQKPNGYFHNPSYSDTDSVSDSVSDTQEQEKTPAPKVASKRARKSAGVPLADEFTTFWEAYPRKVAKPNAQKAWTKLVNAGELPDMDTLLAAVANQADAKDWHTDQQFCPHPATWLNGKRWEDSVTPTRGVDTSWHKYRDWSSRYLDRRRAMHPDDTPQPTQDIVDAGARFLGEWICEDGYSEPQMKAAIVWLLERPERCQYVKHIEELNTFTTGGGGFLHVWAINGAMGMEVQADPMKPCNLNADGTRNED